jgi:hypothetical protein
VILDKSYCEEWRKATAAIKSIKPKKEKKPACRNNLRKDKYRESSGVIFTGRDRFASRNSSK